MTLGRAGIQHRVGMTGNQPGHDDLLPRPALVAKRAAYQHSRTYVLIVSREFLAIPIFGVAGGLLEMSRFRERLVANNGDAMVGVSSARCGFDGGMLRFAQVGRFNLPGW